MAWAMLSTAMRKNPWATASGLRVSPVAWVMTVEVNPAPYPSQFMVGLVMVFRKPIHGGPPTKILVGNDNTGKFRFGSIPEISSKVVRARDGLAQESNEQEAGDFHVFFAI